jgi:hypothetical protein
VPSVLSFMYLFIFFISFHAIVVMIRSLLKYLVR